MHFQLEKTINDFHLLYKFTVLFPAEKMYNLTQRQPDI